MERVYSAVFGEDVHKAVALVPAQEDDAREEEPYVQPLTPELLEQHNKHIDKYGDMVAHASTALTAPSLRRQKSVTETVELSELGEAFKAGVRAFVLAYGAKAFTALLLASRKWGMNTNSYADALRLLSQGDTVRFGAFVGLLVGSFHATEVVLKYVRGSDDPLNKAIAGAVSGLSLFLDAPSRRPVISLYIFVRMLDIYLRHASESHAFVRDIEAYLPMQYATEILFGLANAPIIYATAYDPSLLPKSYYNFILTMGNLSHHGTDFTLRRRLRGELDPNTNQLVAFTPCQPHFHRESCLAHSAKDWVSTGVVRAGKVYLPVHLMPLVLFRYKKLATAPVATLARVAFDTLRSAAFLSTYQIMVKMLVCSSRNFFQEDYPLVAFLAGVRRQLTVTGASLFFEDPKRRTELMLYTGVRGLEVMWAFLKRQGVAQYIRAKHGDVFFFCLSMACIMSSPPAHFKPAYLSLLRFMFGASAIV
ncbi:Aste57867_21055 [Aphanomyces stellatus]|uniref:Aste57867_21055 protein n=1 Tax=Aphanomyces stellatus TaxID=120398 RepID=A0A485LHY6_9STRA|nr:hypothetical protein As57867_020987 [Aphanomyces stellatus]VFT97730.1 Aste57867_21055 [Aphanomyces stellatus]